MISKNSIILHNQEFGLHKFTILHSHEIFDRQDMTNLLESIENKTYVYDDIVNIDITNLLEIKTITDLPRKLKTIQITNTTLETLTIPEQCVDITSIIIKGSNLERIPEIHFLTKLNTLNIENSNLQHLPSNFPSSLNYINFTGNSLSEQNCDLTKFPKNISIILFNNQFREKKLVAGYQFCYGTQCGRTHNPITNYLIQRRDAREVIRDAVGRDIGGIQELRYDPLILTEYRAEINLRQPNTGDVPVVREQTMFNSSQTVHISSICNSVTKSIQKIKELTNDIYIKRSQQSLINEFMDEFYNKNWYDKFLNNFSYVNYIKETIYTWINDTSVHTKTQICYSELLARVWILVKNHEQKKDFIENVKIELNSSVGMCFTGRINRLVNALVGFIDGITVGISIKEQLQLEIGKIIAKLSKKEIKYEDAVKDISVLFEDPDVKEDETVTSYYKQAWLDALDDYKEYSEDVVSDVEERLNEDLQTHMTVVVDEITN